MDQIPAYGARLWWCGGIFFPALSAEFSRRFLLKFYVEAQQIGDRILLGSSPANALRVVLAPVMRNQSNQTRRVMTLLIVS